MSDQTTPGKIILIHGASSAGKSITTTKGGGLNFCT
jgi:chloramphenicol 3-O-phosphotransferase